MWRIIETAPRDRRIALSVIENDEVHALAFPCRRDDGGWINDATGELVFVRPTHWQDWPEAAVVVRSKRTVPVRLDKSPH